MKSMIFYAFMCYFAWLSLWCLTKPDFQNPVSAGSGIKLDAGELRRSGLPETRDEITVGVPKPVPIRAQAIRGPPSSQGFIKRRLPLVETNLAREGYLSHQKTDHEYEGLAPYL